MKIKSILLAGLIALGFMACNNEEVPQVPNGPEGNVSVKVVASSESATRAVGDLSEAIAAESNVVKTQVWVFFGDLLDGYGEAEADEVKDIPVHVGLRDIYIVVNGGGVGLTKFSTKAEIAAAVTSVPVDIAENGLVMTAEKITKTLVAGKNYIGFGSAPANGTSIQDETVKVERVNARVAITSAVLDLTGDANQTDIFDNLKDVEVAMFNVNELAKIFNDNDASGDWLYGADWPSSLNSYEKDTEKDTEKDHFLQAITTVSGTVLIKDDAAPYFYVNPLQDVNKMFIVLRGKAYKGDNPVIAEGLYTDAAGNTYYPVWVNGEDLGYNFGTHTSDGKIARNTQYNIKLTIKGIGNPTIDEVESAFLDVKVEVEPWATVTQEVEWKPAEP